MTATSSIRKLHSHFINTHSDNDNDIDDLLSIILVIILTTFASLVVSSMCYIGGLLNNMTIYVCIVYVSLEIC